MLGRSTVDALSTQGPHTIRITHPAHPFRGQIFDVVPMFGGTPEPTHILIMLSNRERRLIPLEWTDQCTQTVYPSGSRFCAERLVAVRQRLDQLLLKADKQAILLVKNVECHEPGDNHANHRNYTLAAAEPGATVTDHCHTCADASPQVDATNDRGGE